MGGAGPIDYHPDESESAADDGGNEASMLHGFLRTLVKVAVASLIVGTILAHFGITSEQVVREFGLSQDRIMELARQGVTWALRQAGFALTSGFDLSISSTVPALR